MKLLKESIIGLILIVTHFALFAQKETKVQGTILNNQYEEVVLKLAYKADAPSEYGKATITEQGTFLLTSTNITRSDIFKLEFSDNDFFLMVLHPGDQVKIAFDANNLQSIVSVSGSPSMSFVKRMADLLARNKKVMDSINVALQQDKEQLYYNQFFQDLHLFHQTNNDVDQHITHLYRIYDTLQTFVSSKSKKEHLKSKNIDYFISQVITCTKQMENDYTPLANYLVNAPKYYDFSTGVPQAAQAFYQQFKQSYLDKINERHQIAVSGLGTLMAEVKKINAKRDSLMYGDHLSKSKVKKSMGEELFQLLQNYPVPPNNENQYIKEITNTNQAAEELKAQSQEKVRQVIQSYQSAYNKETERVNQVIMQQLMDNKDELAVLMFVDIYKRDQFPDLHQQVAHALYAKYPEHPLVVERYKVETSPKNSTNIGSMAPDLAFPDPDGKIIKLSDLRGKVVLLDFWAAWCRPCRMENPNVVKAYHQYKDKGFDVYSVSLDRDKNAWLKAIQDDGLVWPSHVSDLKHWSSEAAAIYGVRSIPATFLIGKDGRIVAKNLRGDALVNTLKQLLGE